MSGNGITAPSSGRVRISNTWLNDNASDPTARANVMTLEPEEAFENVKVPKIGNGGTFEARAISIGGDIVDNTATYADLNGQENDDPFSMVETLQTHILHPVRYKYIYAQDTTARSITIHQ